MAFARRRLAAVSQLLAVVGAAALVVAGCGASAGSDSEGGERGGTTTTLAPPVLDPPVVLSRFGACADAWVWAADAEGTVAVTAYVEAEDRSATAPTTYEFALPDDGVEVEVLRGRDLARNFCTDVIDQDAEPASTEAAVAGTVRIDVDANPGDMAGCGTAKVRFAFTDVESDDGTRFVDAQAETTGIGCYAG